MPKYDIGELIAALNDAVNKLNNLRAKHDDLEKENARLREALRFYAGDEPWKLNSEDFGNKARAALGETQ